MINNNAILNRNALLLFNFWSMTQNKNKRIGDLTLGDFFELCELLTEVDNAAN
jgi:hypothetical protein